MSGPGGVLPEKAQVYVHDVLAESREEVLAVSGDRVQDPAIDQGRTGCEGALRAADPHWFAGEMLRLISGQTVQRMTFGHAGSLPPLLSPLFVTASVTAPVARLTELGARLLADLVVVVGDCEFAQYVGQGTYACRAVLGLGELVRRMRDAARVADEQHCRRDAGR